MNVQLSWDVAVLAGLVALLIFWLGAIAEYLWHSIHHRHH